MSNSSSKSETTWVRRSAFVTALYHVHLILPQASSLLSFRGALSPGGGLEAPKGFIVECDSQGQAYRFRLFQWSFSRHNSDSTCQPRRFKPIYLDYCAKTGDLDMQSESFPISSERSSRRLEQVARLRAYGVSDHVGLPQLVVGGDQSTGKSSVMEGVTGIPFPRQDGLCTRFATEVTLRHEDQPLKISATIIPASTRDEAGRARLKAFKKTMDALGDLPTAIQEAGSLMGLQGYGNTSGAAFVEDILSIKVTGRTGLHLTIVDLPGLIANPESEQNDDDPEVVHRLVDSYLRNPRTIILAVIQSSNDVANQGIIKKARNFDKNGERTVGILTKPDLVNHGTEARVASLAANEGSIKLSLGFYLVKNPTPEELKQDWTSDKRLEEEQKFFSSPPWTDLNLNMDRIGMRALRNGLQGLLDHHIERELPKVRNEIRKAVEAAEKNLRSLGAARTETSEMRLYVSRLTTRLHGISLAAVSGTYDQIEAGFFASSIGSAGSVRLRAHVHHLNSDFEQKIRLTGQKRKVTDRMDTISPPRGESSSDRSITPIEDVSEESSGDQLTLSLAEMKKWVKSVYRNTRGVELPGNYNHVLLSDLFHEQSSKWLHIAEDHVNRVYESISDCITASLRYVTNNEREFRELWDLTEGALHERKGNAVLELEKLWKDELGNPMTYNHYYTDNIQKNRDRKVVDKLEQSIRSASRKDQNQIQAGLDRGGNMDPLRLATTLSRTFVVDMEDQACLEALDGLNAYYKVAMKTFIDNVCRQVIERHLLRDLDSLFAPEIIWTLKDEKVKRIAAEAPEKISQRSALQNKIETLKKGLEDLKH